MAGLLVTAFFLASAVSIDTLGCGFAYGVSRTRVPFPHVIVLDVIGSVFMGLSLFLGYAVSRIISPEVTIVISVTALALTGLYKIIQSVRKKRRTQGHVTKQIAWGETFALSFVLSIDSIAVGLGAAVYNVSISFCLIVVVFSLIIDAVMFVAGHRLGRKIANKKTTLDLSWLSGVVLIVMAIGKIFL